MMLLCTACSTARRTGLRYGGASAPGQARRPGGIKSPPLKHQK
jgi:hypothetical protein